ncbi:MAG: bifunctional metallophosphatase/5'-nucleotidase [Akkermansia sp.]|nr:bifunctional metallophosphatase/5'-nucleotidase [Akkermansia sp.]
MKKALFLPLLSLLGSAFAEQITILGINDMHANIDSVPRLTTCVQQERAKAPQLLLLSAGDNRTGSPYVDCGDHPGASMIQLMNHIGFDLSALGNHEFDGGPAALAHCINAADFEFVSANVFPSDTHGIQLKPYKIFERDGVRIGVLGLLQVDANGRPDAHPDQCKGIGFLNPLEVAPAFRYLRSQCDILILLTHLGFETDIELARIFPEADAIIGGHSHTRVENGHTENGVLITQTQNKLKYLTRLTFDVDNGKVLSKKAELLPLNKYEADATTADMVEKIKAQPFFKRVLSTVKRDIPRRESLGCMMADAIRSCVGTDIAVVNMGNVRLDTFPAGPITVADVYSLDPFGNDTIRMTVTGTELLRVLENITQNDDHGAPCVSGMSYKAIWPKGADRMRITTASLADGTPINPEGRYTLAINSYLCATTEAMPADPGVSAHIDGATSMIKVLETLPEIDYAEVSRVEMTKE